MCGLVAILSPAGELAESDLARPLRALRRRGPDGVGTWVSPTGRAALGHTRLATVDLETGDQPICDRQGRYCLAANGEFYDYREIRTELIASGVRFRTRSDSEIALHLYAQSGPRALDRLRGEFGFVIWDERRGELFAARDRFGVKPLYYAEHGGRIYLASEAKALFAAGVPARWDAAAFADHLLVCYPADRTLFAGVRQLPPGCYLLAGPAGVSAHPYWDLDYPTAAELSESPADRATAGPDRVAAALRDAVRARMRADVPVAYHLSGGVDSSAVVGLARACSGADPLPTFTVRFDARPYDESAVAARTAARVGARHTEIPFAPGDLARRIGEVVAAGEMIQENAHGVARMMQSEAIRAAGYKVALGGEGGDEMFAGYPQFLKDLEFTRSAAARAKANASYATLAGHGMPPHLKLLWDRLGFVPNWILERYLQVTLPLRGLLREEFAAVLDTRAVGADLLDGRRTAPRIAGRTPFHQSLYLFCKTWLCNYILAAERLDMAHAVEVRLPFLDHRVAEVAGRIPLDAHNRGGVTKAALREAVRDQLSEEVYRGVKQGFFAPPVMTSDAAMSRLREIAVGPAGLASPFFDPAKVAAFVDRVLASPPAHRARHERVIHIVAGAALLADTFGMSSAEEVRDR